MKDYSCFNRQKGANVFPVTTHPASAHIPLLITPGGKAFPLLPCGGPVPAGMDSELGSLSRGHGTTFLGQTSRDSTASPAAQATETRV